MAIADVQFTLLCQPARASGQFHFFSKSTVRSGKSGDEHAEKSYQNDSCDVASPGT